MEHFVDEQYARKSGLYWANINGGLVYLLLEEDSQKYWIAECNQAVCCLIINEALGCIDYYITDKKFHWLITENHHDFVQFLGAGLDVNIIESVCTAAHRNEREIHGIYKKN
ncbi:MAG: hypothetical protein J6J86_00375 [Lachnospiraceae bacterium]|nr:hypothetical protein [Lachnospiraceae bacterium]